MLRVNSELAVRGYHYLSTSHPVLYWSRGLPCSAWSLRGRLLSRYGSRELKEISDMGQAAYTSSRCTIRDSSSSFVSVFSSQPVFSQELSAGYVGHILHLVRN